VPFLRNTDACLSIPSTGAFLPEHEAVAFLWAVFESKVGVHEPEVIEHTTIAFESCVFVYVCGYARMYVYMRVYHKHTLPPQVEGGGQRLIETKEISHSVPPLKKKLFRTEKADNLFTTSLVLPRLRYAVWLQEQLERAAGEREEAGEEPGVREIRERQLWALQHLLSRPTVVGAPHSTKNKAFAACCLQCVLLLRRAGVVDDHLVVMGRVSRRQRGLDRHAALTWLSRQRRDISRRGIWLRWIPRLLLPPPGSRLLQALTEDRGSGASGGATGTLRPCVDPARDGDAGEVRNVHICRT
jgi:hypothetical protein